MSWLGDPPEGPPPQFHSHLVQHMGYRKAAAQVLGAGTGGWNLECLQLRGKGKDNGEIQIGDPQTPLLQTLLASRHLIVLGEHWPLLRHASATTSAHLELKGAWPHFASAQQTPRAQVWASPLVTCPTGTT
jgi:hypothetical protein